ncbi:carbohydrate ABC transporter permease [Mycoplasmatota bacterium]|nr:carbohydrate ABC transporter permease [Mycoplasmatota bacterium]
MTEKILRFNKHKLRRKLFGYKLTDGLVFRILIYTLLVTIGFVYVYPLLHMISFSFQSLEDLLNPMVSQVPSSFYFKNYGDAFTVLKYFETMGSSLAVTLLPAILQTFVASLVGYGFARFNFPLKKTLLALVVATYIIPPQVTMIPKYVLFFNIGILETVWSIIIPASLGQGLNSAIFILIFYQFYKMIPKVLDEAAQIDGASRIYTYFKIAIPLSIPSFITSFLFSFVWYWNETYISTLFLGNGVETLQMRLADFVSEYSSILGSSQAINYANEAVRMAATMLIILPMLLVYFIMQRWFIEGIDRAGITGE